MNFNQQLTSENEKLKIKIKYLENLFENLHNFEQTQALIDLKQFIDKNYKRFSLLLDEIYHLKQQLESEQQMKQKEFSKLNNEIQQLKSVIQQQLEKEQEQTNLYNSLNQSQINEQILNQSNTIKQLSEEIEEITTANQKMREQLKKKDFFREYDLMCKEVEGLRQQNQKLTDQLKVQKITNSNNSNNNIIT